MRRVHALSSLALAAAGCASGAFAQHVRSRTHPAPEGGLPFEALARAMHVRAEGRQAGGAPGGSAFELSSAWRSVARGSAGVDGGLSTLDTGFESLQPLPADLVNQLDTVTWGGAAAGVTGRAHFSAVTAPLAPPQYGVVTDPIGGNATRKLRGWGDPAYGPDAFFGRWARINFLRTNTPSPTQQGAERFVFYPTANRPLRVEHDMFVSMLDSWWYSEPTSVARARVASRVSIGPRQTTDGVTYPPGFIVSFADVAGSVGAVEPTRPAGDPNEGFPYAVPIGRWFRVIHEFDAFGGVRYLINYYDGAGPIEIFRGRALVPWGRVDRMVFSGDFAAESDACYVDNLHVEGGDAPPFPPCPGDATYDRVVDFADLNVVLVLFGFTGPNLFGDLDGDGDVDFTDLNIVLGAYGGQCSA